MRGVALTGLLCMVGSTVKCAEPAKGIPFRPLAVRESAVAVGVYRSQEAWNDAVQAAYKDARISPARSRPVDWKKEMVVAAPSFVSFVQSHQDSITVLLIGSASKGPNSNPYLIALPASPDGVRFVPEPAMTDGPFYEATVTRNNFVAVTKTVVLFPHRGVGTNTRQRWGDTTYSPLRERTLAILAEQMESLRFTLLPGSSTDVPGRLGEGFSCRVSANVNGKAHSASYDGLSDSDAPKPLLKAVRLIFAAAGTSFPVAGP